MVKVAKDAESAKNMQLVSPPNPLGAHGLLVHLNDGEDSKTWIQPLLITDSMPECFGICYKYEEM